MKFGTNLYFKFFTPCNRCLGVEDNRKGKKDMRRDDSRNKTLSGTGSKNLTAGSNSNINSKNSSNETSGLSEKVGTDEEAGN